MSQSEVGANTDSDIPHYFSVADHIVHGNLRKDDTLPSPPEGYSWSEPCMMGIDEAGRGPVLGHMVYGSCIAPISKLDDLKTLKFNDSKVLQEAVRDELFKKIKACDYISWIVDPISPQEISAKMLRVPPIDLNSISHGTAMNFVSLYLAKGYNIQELYVDTVGDPKKYQAMLKSRFPSIGTIVVESKADATYPIVSAASICAKVTRDEALRNWVFREAEHGVQISTTLGCGYPSDGITKKWLADHTDPVFGFPDLTRFSWSTSSNMLKKQEAHVVTWGDENDENPRQQQKLGKFFTKSETGVTGADATNVPLKSRSYISRRGHLNIVSSLSLPVGGGDNK